MLIQDFRQSPLQINTCPQVLNKNVAFKGGADAIVNEKAESFSNDLIALINEKPNIKYRDIEELVRKATGEKIAVRPYKELEQNEQTSGMVAFYKAPIGVISGKNGQLEIVEGKREIFINLPQDNSKEERSAFIRSAVHEFTHVCQDKYGTYSKKDLMSALIGSAMLNYDAKVNTLNATQPARLEYINAITGTFAGIMRNANIGDATNIEQATDEYLNSLMMPVIKCDVPRYCRRSLNKSMSAMPKNTDTGYVKNYLFNIAKREEQANQNGSAASKKYLRDDNSTGYDLFAVLYRNLADACK